jgi:hypothetical protein
MSPNGPRVGDVAAATELERRRACANGVNVLLFENLFFIITQIQSFENSKTP